MKILIVDDEKIILEKLKMYISQIFTEKENIFTSDNAAKALEVTLSPEDISYLEEPYIPHRIVGAIDHNPAEGVMLLDEKK